MFLGSSAKVAGLVALLLLAGCTVQPTRPSISRENSESLARPSMAVIKPHLFDRQETQAFINAARKADAIADPLQRCIAFPDPPGSHWAQVSVKAYCQYLFQPVPSVMQVTGLIQSGHTAQLDQLMADALTAQRNDPASFGKLEHWFAEDFENVTPQLRSALDEWKRQAPRSAFAYAASGFAYESAAYDVRGKNYDSETPDANMIAMKSLLELADVDLQRAIQLNPQITSAYVAMIEAGGLALGKSYGEQAALLGSQVDPTSYQVYSMWLWLEQPIWVGSLPAMSAVIARVQPHVSAHPLLAVLLSKRRVFEADMQDCDCNSVTQLAQYPVVFDQVALSNELAHAGYAAHASHHPELAVVYLAEALRFDPSIAKARKELDVDFGDMDATGASAPDLVWQEVGPPVQQVHAANDELPSFITMGVVEYPDVARKAHVTGTVVTLTYVGKDGVPLKCIVESQSFIESGYDSAGKLLPSRRANSITTKDGKTVALADLFDPAAIRAMMQSRFHPGKHDGAAVISIVRVPLFFKVDRKQPAAG